MTGERALRGGRIHFVCARNVCRSPAMALAFLGATRVGVDSEWAVTTSGIVAGTGEHMCRTAAAIVREQGRAGASPDGHRSRRTDAAEIARQELILVASRAERAHIAHIDPSARSRTFTLREAVFLSEPGEWGEAKGPGDRGSSPAARFAALLHERRGVRSLPAPERALLFTRAVDPLDYLDAHVTRGVPHRTVIRNIVTDALTLHDRLGDLTSRA